MHYKYSILPVFVFLVFILSFNAREKNETCSPYSIAFCKEKNISFIGDVTGNSLIVYDNTKKEITTKLSLPGKPGKIKLSSNKKNLFVTIAESKGYLLILDTHKLKQIKKIETGHTPTDVWETDLFIYVCNKYDNNVSIVDKSNFTLTEKVIQNGFRFPEKIIVQNNKLFIADLLPQHAGTDINIACKIHVVDLNNFKTINSIVLPSGSNAIKGCCSSPDGKYLYFTHLVGRFYIPAKTVKRGWMNTNALSIIDAESNKLIATTLLDYPDKGSANPWGITCSSDGKEIAIALSGTDEILIIDRLSLHKLVNEKNNRFGTKQAIEEMVNDLSFITEVKHRIPVHNSKGIRDIITINEGYLATAYFTANVIEINNRIPNIIKLAEQQTLTSARKGEIYFHDAKYCFQDWQSCASCHTDEGRIDGLNWDLLNDGIGNPKNTKSLLFAHETPPSMATGIRKDAKTSVRAGIKHSLFRKGINEDVALSIDAYLQSLKPIKSPYLTSNGKLTNRALKGKKFFKEKGCTSCHSGDYFTNQKSYNLNLGTGIDSTKKFDTPSLIEVWRTAPYLHDGRAVTLEEIFNKYVGLHVPYDLKEEEVSLLVEYLKSL